MKRVLQLGKYLAFAAYGVAGVLLILFLVPQTGWKALTVKTGSMTPAIPVGSLVVVHRTTLSALALGDIVTYTNPSDSRQTITHRIVSRGETRGIPTFITKGDANSGPDHEIVGGSIVGKVVWHVPVLGKISSGVGTVPGVIILVVIPGLFIIADEWRRLKKSLRSAKQPVVPAGPPPSQTLMDTEATSPAPDEPAQVIEAPVVQAQTAPQNRPARRVVGMDGVSRTAKVLLVAAVVLAGVGSTYSLWSSQAVLTHNTFAINFPTTKDDCKNDGWKNYGFKNQGQCIAYVNSLDHPPKSDTSQ